jgi:hypothetical protein
VIVTVAPLEVLVVVVPVGLLESLCKVTVPALLVIVTVELEWPELIWLLPELDE